MKAAQNRAILSGWDEVLCVFGSTVPADSVIVSNLRFVLHRLREN
jgi:hypothetical protein